MWWSVAIGVASVVAGLAASRIWGLAPGGTIVLISAAIFAVVALVKRATRPEAPGGGGGAVNAELHAAVELRLRAIGQRYTPKRRALVDALVKASNPVAVPDLAPPARAPAELARTATSPCSSRRERSTA